MPPDFAVPMNCACKALVSISKLGTLLLAPNTTPTYFPVGSICLAKWVSAKLQAEDKDDRSVGF